MINRKQLRTYMAGMFKYYPKYYQTSFAMDCLNHQRVVGVFCRQSGKSETTSKISIMLARKTKKGDVLIFAPTDRQSGLIADKIRNSIASMPYLQNFHIVRETQREFKFSNGRSIICETVGDKGESIRGYTAGDIILEEAGSIKDSIIQEVIMPMGSTTNAKIIKIGTPRGKNHFFESSRSHLYKTHLYDYTHAVRAGLITQEYIDEMRRVTPDIIFRTEYGAEFIEDQDAFFGYDLINKCVYAIPYMPETSRFYLGGDIARLGQDSTCLTVVNVDMKNIAHVVEIVELNKYTLDRVIDKIKELHKKYKFKRIFLDETGLGAGVTDMLAKEFNMPKLQQGANITGFPKQQGYGDVIVGVRFTIQSKLDIFSNLKVLMEAGRVYYPNNPKLVAQLRDFRYEITDNQNIKLHHSEYGYDDYVDSLALACKEVNVKPIGFSF